jgi:AraC-like DNA-binding protein
LNFDGVYRLSAVGYGNTQKVGRAAAKTFAAGQLTAKRACGNVARQCCATREFAGAQEFETMSRTPQQAFAGLDFSSGRLFQTEDLDEARILCGRVFNPHDLQITGQASRLRSQMDHLPLGRVSLNRLTWGAPVRVDPDRLATYYLVSMPVRGRAQFNLGGELTQVSPHCVGIVNAAQRFRFDASEGFEQIALRIERNAIDVGWLALTGEAPSIPIDFRCGAPTSDTAWHALEPVMRSLARAAQDAHQGNRLPFLHTRLEELVVTTLLLNQPHTHSELLLRPAHKARPVHIRRAVQFMRERLGETLTASDVARACGVSIRTLQAAFHSAYGCGPMSWLRTQRLHGVHDALCSHPDARASITDTALRFGFTHLGEFSKAYRQQFGETPSMTLSR